MHHIIAVQDGGDDSPQNLIPLCRSCHDEWHTMEAHYLFRQWLGTIPSRWIVHLNQSPLECLKGLTLEESIALLKRFIFDDPLDAWFWQERNDFLDQHEAIYGQILSFQMQENKPTPTLIREITNSATLQR
jgi:hypothetical protein